MLIHLYPKGLNLLTTGHKLLTTAYMPRTLIIYNPTAGRARRAIDEVRAVMSAMNSAAYEIYETTGPGAATTRTRAALPEGYTTIAAVGGDGTLGETATGFFDWY